MVKSTNNNWAIPLGSHYHIGDSLTDYTTEKSNRAIQDTLQFKQSCLKASPNSMAVTQQLELNINYGSELIAIFPCKVGYLVKIRSNSLLNCKSAAWPFSFKNTAVLES
jgi:hypothetical protein